MTPPRIRPTPEEREAARQAKALQAAQRQEEKAAEVERRDRAARQALRDAHACPRVDLATEPWIAVVRPDGGIDHLGVTATLTQAHLIRDLAEPHPLVRAGLRRFLTGLAIDLVRRSRLSIDDWLDLVEAGDPLPADLVAVTMTAHRDHLWLWHPVSPFLQDIRLIDQMVSVTDVKAVHDIVPDLPSDSSAAWFVKPGDTVTRRPLPALEVARWLVARWFYGLPGNSAHVRCPDGSTNGSQAGGAFTETIATITHVWRVHPEHLLGTLLRNIPATAVAGTSGDGCAWADMARVRPSTDPLYLATATATATLLASRTETGDVTGVLRAPIPGDKAQIKAIRATATSVDFHRISLLRGSAKPRPVQIEPAQKVEVLSHFYRGGLDDAVLSGAVTSGQLWLTGLHPRTAEAESVELLLASKSGNGSSPGWADVTVFALPAAYLDADHSRAPQVRAACAAAFDPVTGLHSRIATAVRTLLQPARPQDTAVTGLTRSVQERWLTDTAALLEEAAFADSPPGTDWMRRLRHAACTAFAETCAPYITSTRYAAPYARALARLRSTSRRVS